MKVKREVRVCDICSNERHEVLCRKCYGFNTTQKLFKRINKEIINYLKEKREKQKLKNEVKQGKSKVD